MKGEVRHALLGSPLKARKAWLGGDGGAEREKIKGASYELQAQKRITNTCVGLRGAAYNITRTFRADILKCMSISLTVNISVLISLDYKNSYEHLVNITSTCKFLAIDNDSY